MVFGMNDGGSEYNHSIPYKVDALASYSISDMDGGCYENILRTSDVANFNEWGRVRLKI
jgi:hypothetical protein